MTNPYLTLLPGPRVEKMPKFPRHLRRLLEPLLYLSLPRLIHPHRLLPHLLRPALWHSSFTLLAGPLSLPPLPFHHHQVKAFPSVDCWLISRKHQNSISIKGPDLERGEWFEGLCAEGG
jgi:hypothetical protein